MASWLPDCLLSTGDLNRDSVVDIDEVVSVGCVPETARTGDLQQRRQIDLVAEGDYVDGDTGALSHRSSFDCQFHGVRVGPAVGQDDHRSGVAGDEVVLEELGCALDAEVDPRLLGHSDQVHCLVEQWLVVGESDQSHGFAVEAHNCSTVAIMQMAHELLRGLLGSGELGSAGSRCLQHAGGGVQNEHDVSLELGRATLLLQHDRQEGAEGHRQLRVPDIIGSLVVRCVASLECRLLRELTSVKLEYGEVHTACRRDESSRSRPADPVVRSRSPRNSGRGDLVLGDHFETSPDELPHLHTASAVDGQQAVAGHRESVVVGHAAGPKQVAIQGDDHRLAGLDVDCCDRRVAPAVADYRRLVRREAAVVEARSPELPVVAFRVVSFEVEDGRESDRVSDELHLLHIEAEDLVVACDDPRPLLVLGWEDLHGWSREFHHGCYGRHARVGLESHSRGGI